MNPKPLSKKIVLNDGREIIIETGKLAKQAHGSVVIKMGNCMLLSTVVSNYGESTLDFLPLTCLLYTSPSPRDPVSSRMPSSA